MFYSARFGRRGWSACAPQISPLSLNTLMHPFQPAIQLADRAGADFPRLRGNDRVARTGDLHLAIVFAAAVLSFDHDVIALSEVFHRAGQSIPSDEPMPIGVRLPLAGRLVPPRGLGGELQDGEAIDLVGLVGDESDEGHVVDVVRGSVCFFLFRLFVLFMFLRKTKRNQGSNTRPLRVESRFKWLSQLPTNSCSPSLLGHKPLRN
jgi:hypothetical protein